MHRFAVFLLFLCVCAVPQVASAEAILWDISHGVFSPPEYKPTGVYSGLRGQLMGMGHTVEEGTVGIMSTDLSAYDVLVVNQYSSYYFAYNPAEATKVLDYVSNGGGLLIMGDNHNAPFAHLLPLTTPLGTNVSRSEMTPWSETDFTLASHPIFDGVSTIRVQAAGEIEIWQGTMIATQTTTGKGLVAVQQYGAGRVVVMGDCEPFANAYRYDEDNIQWAENTFNWLVPEPGTLSLLGLASLAVFRRRR